MTTIDLLDCIIEIDRTFPDIRYAMFFGDIEYVVFKNEQIDRISKFGKYNILIYLSKRSVVSIADKRFLENL